MSVRSEPSSQPAGRRRDAGAGMVSSAAGVTISFCWRGSVMAVDRTISVLGLGSIGLRHATNLSKRGYTVVGFDPDEGRRKGAANIGVRAVARREDAIVAADIVVIASPSQH